MGNRIYVLCRSATKILYGDIVEQMGHMGFLAREARFDPPLDDSNKTSTDWGAFELHYRDGASPITVEQVTQTTDLENVVDDIREKLREEPVSAVTSALLEQLESSRHGLLFELAHEIPADAWE